MLKWLIPYPRMDINGEIQWCTLIMEADQKLLDLAGSLLQTISRTQENLGEMLKIQKRQNEMNHQILQDY